MTAPQQVTLHPAKRDRIILGVLTIAIIGFLFVSVYFTTIQLIPASFSSGLTSPNFVLVPVFFLFFIQVAMLILASRLYGNIQTHLIISEKGVVFDSYWEKLSVTWDDIEKITTVPFSGVATEAFVLRSEVSFIYRWGGFPFFRFKPVCIPVSGFGRTYGDNPLAQAIRQFAPERLSSSV